MSRKILVTGAAGFLGSHFVRRALQSGADEVVNVDVLTYAGDLRRLADVEDDERYRFIRADVADAPRMKSIMASEKPDFVVHYAADSHVTRSENDPGRFFRTNVDGTRSILEAAAATGVQRVLHISTDEVYGPIIDGSFAEEDKPPGVGAATSPYAQSKALADDLALSYAGQIDVVLARPTNAFGPWQFPEKALARWITRGLRGEPLLVWGDGLYTRQWLHAEDFAEAIWLLLAKGARGQAYNVGPVHDPEITNLDLARWLTRQLDLPDDRLQMTEYDRPDHDRRYAVDPARIAALGWSPGQVWDQFTDTVEWFRANEAWWAGHVAEAESIYKDAAGTAR